MDAKSIERLVLLARDKIISRDNRREGNQRDGRAVFQCNFEAVGVNWSLCQDGFGEHLSSRLDCLVVSFRSTGELQAFCIQIQLLPSP
ncbi:hypothetical protein QWJ46_12455 [Rhizobium sp. CBN3]|uniref:hypothetical protein n=1 Tax=Rhizobium sp. CBN3 TaxID=3058045 RepID=UPI0026735ECB|nr:hypothetical protein [Rhizobium sp. CBN3]MDO3433500.1 hypothetical protein [Rhizobium sp. CBN3]